MSGGWWSRWCPGTIEEAASLLAGRPLMAVTDLPPCPLSPCAPHPSPYARADQCDTGDLLVLIKPGTEKEGGPAAAAPSDAALAGATA